MGALILILGAGAVLAFMASGKKKPEIDLELESKMIGSELVALPEESRAHIFRLLLTEDPAFDAGAYAGAILQLTQLATFPFTVDKLVRISKERFG